MSMCDDGNYCTTDICSGNGVCSHSSPDPLCRSCKSTNCTTTDLCQLQICSADGSGCETDQKGLCDDKGKIQLYSILIQLILIQILFFFF